MCFSQNLAGQKFLGCVSVVIGQNIFENDVTTTGTDNVGFQINMEFSSSSK